MAKNAKGNILESGYVITTHGKSVTAYANSEKPTGRNKITVDNTPARISIGTIIQYEIIPATNSYGDNKQYRFKTILKESRIDNR